MPLRMRRDADGFSPEVRCDVCGAFVSASGFTVWPVDWSSELPVVMSVNVACSEACVESIAEAGADEGEWIATPLSVYLGTLVDRLGIDVEQVLEVERASIAAERTRDQSPD